MCEGGMVADAIAAVASIDPVMGGVDRDERLREEARAAMSAARRDCHDGVPRAGPAPRRTRAADQRTGGLSGRRGRAAGGRRRADRRALPAGPFGAAAAAAPGAVRRRLPHPGRHRVLRSSTGPDRRRSHRGGDVLLDVPAHADRRLPGRGVHQHAVRDHGRRRDPRSAARLFGHSCRADHRRRPGHARARRMQRGLRLRPGRDGQLGVLRQPDAVVGPRSGRRAAGGRPPGADPRRPAVHVPGDRQNPCRPAGSAPGHGTRARPGPPPLPGCGSPRSGT